jgi:hypothetical protein
MDTFRNISGVQNPLYILRHIGKPVFGWQQISTKAHSRTEEGLESIGHTKAHGWEAFPKGARPFALG